ncbi:MAG: DUF5009 domain-containing protein [Bacteroidota bacterium]
MNKPRIASIDILRALTMLLMIWVNDFFTLTGVPKWLSHASASEDYMGFSDIIFPLFLFIMGLSIPFAIQQRKVAGASTISIATHIVIRAASLLVMGFFMVNLETAHHESIVIGKHFWGILMALALVLIWLNWRKSPIPKTWHYPMQLAGVLLLIFLAVIYKGGTDGTSEMTPQWWGILGLIGWAYFANALIYLFANGNRLIILFFFLLFNTLTVLNHAHLLPELSGFLNYLSILYHGTIPAFTIAGIIAALLIKDLSANSSKRIMLTLIVIGIINIGYGFLIRPYWGISKIQATPAWLGICTGIGFISFALFYFMADIKKWTGWAKIIAPAGTATLTCYMIPYFVYPLRNISNIRLPELLNEDLIGLLVSFGFALLVVVFTGWLEKKGYKLKL